jgi:beta-lactamase regulating signal transducer with metallopeptidase domain
MSDALFSLLAGTAVRSAIILIASLLAARLLVRRSAAVRHAVFTAGIVGVIVVPIVMLLLPAVRAPFVGDAVSATLAWLERPVRSLRRETNGARPVNAADAAVVDGINLRSSEEMPSTSRGGLILVMLWAAGVLILGSRTAVRSIRAFRLSGRARPVDDAFVLATANAIARRQGQRRAPPILETAELSAPATVGILRSAVLLPAARSWSDEHLRTVLAHELAHVTRRDCLTQRLAQVACALHWFNPLVWVVERRMALERERSCDDVAMGQAGSADGYATLLLDLARRTCERSLPQAAVLAMAQPSELETRLVAILDPSRDRGLVTRRTRRALALVAAAIIALSGTVHLEAAPVVPNVAPPLPPQVVQQGHVEPDTRGDSVADPSSERIARASLDVARRRGRGALGGPDSSLTRMLLLALEREPRSREDLVRERAAWALSQVKGNRLIQPLIAALDDTDWRVRAYAAWSLAPARDPRAVPALIREMSHPVWRMRAMAAHALAETSDPRARAVMTAAVSDEAWQVRVNAVRYLGQFTDADARARVRAALRDRHVMVRNAAAQGVAP